MSTVYTDSESGTASDRDCAPDAARARSPMPSATSSAKVPDPLIRHKTLWFLDGNIVLKAGNTLFKIHRGFLCRESEFFSDMLECAEATLEGTDAQPLDVLEVTGATMTNILTMMYTIHGSEGLVLSTDDYVGILKAAHRLMFHKVWEVARNALRGKLSAAKRLHLALSHCGVDEWAIPAFKELVKDPHVEPLGDAHLLSHEIWHEILRLRDQLLQGRRRVTDRSISYRAHDMSQQPPRLCDRHLLDVVTQWNALDLTPDTLHASQFLMTQTIAQGKPCPSCSTRGSPASPSPGELVHKCLHGEAAIFAAYFGETWKDLVKRLT